MVNLMSLPDSVIALYTKDNHNIIISLEEGNVIRVVLASLEKNGRLFNALNVEKCSHRQEKTV